MSIDHRGGIPDPGVVEAVDAILRCWLGDPDLIVFCGEWRHGGLMEMLPRGKAVLTAPHYAGRFSGLRELRLQGGGHHVHLDLGRLRQACYVVAPSVCYGFRPALELRLVAPGGDPMRDAGFGLSVCPYHGDRLREDVARRYFRRAADHIRRYPHIASFTCQAPPVPVEADWSGLDAVLADEAGMAGLRSAVSAAAGGGA